MITRRAFTAALSLTGLGLLARPQGAIGPWARVFGDVLDLAFLGWALSSRSFHRGRTLGVMARRPHAAERERRPAREQLLDHRACHARGVQRGAV